MSLAVKEAGDPWQSCPLLTHTRAFLTFAPYHCFVVLLIGSKQVWAKPLDNNQWAVILYNSRLVGTHEVTVYAHAFIA